jgi:hypothetical protein
LSSYIELPIETDPQDVYDDFVTTMQSLFPEWQPNSATLDTWIGLAMSMAAAESRDVMSAFPRSAFRWFGVHLVNYPAIDAVSAACTSTWTMRDSLGYTIPAGTQVSIARTGDEVFAFETIIDVVIPPGQTVAAGVQLIAVDPGVDATNLGAAGSAVSLIDPLGFVSSVTQEGATSGGVDAETDDEYLGRLSQYLTALAPRPILPADFVIFARAIPGVARATAIDGYDLSLGTSNNARTITLAVVDENGMTRSQFLRL